MTTLERAQRHVSDRVSPEGLARGVPTAIGHTAQLLTVACALAWLYVWIQWTIDNGVFGFDFEGTLWEPGAAIREGRSPYPDPVLAEVDVGNPALYPPPLMLLVTPLTYLPWSVGLLLWTGLLALGLVVALRALDVRDVRCYGIVFISAPVFTGLVWGNATLLLVPLVALAWRFRDRWLWTGALLGAAIVAKLFLWPLLFWLLGTRRYKAFAAAVVSACVGAVGSWLVIDFAGLATYPDLLRVAEKVYAAHSYSLATALNAWGLDLSWATRATLVTGVVIAGIAFAAGRLDTDRTSMSVAVLAAIVGSPIVWEYYYALLIVPLALAWPRFAWPWLGLALIYFTHRLPRPHLTAADLEPGGIACCRPQDVPSAVWIFNHQPPGLWPALAHMVLATAIVALAIGVGRRQHRSRVQPLRRAA